jgi:hypothetical protein
LPPELGPLLLSGRYQVLAELGHSPFVPDGFAFWLVMVALGHLRSTACGVFFCYAFYFFSEVVFRSGEGADKPRA